MLEFIESPIFSRDVHDYLDEDELAQLQQFLSDDPAAGDMIRGSGGCRKLRWSTGTAGKRGGVRTIYYSQTAAGRIWLLMIYSKSAQASVPAHLILKLRNELTGK